ncbi:MAG: hypothetical protein J7M08_05805 [Planctomycetes bacterium]|nr:hypothetical protein [Planctomycetota bacterium]
MVEERLKSSASILRMYRRRGQMIVLFAGLVVVLLGMCALAVDVGMLHATQAQLQNAADAAALAAGLEYVQERNDGSSESEARAAATSEALALGEANADAARFEVEYGTFENGEFQAGPEAATAVKVTALRDGDAPGGEVQTLFAGTLGVASVSAQAQAVVAVFEGISTIWSGLTPLAVWEDDVAALGVTVTIYNDDQIAPGIWGLLNFNGGDNSTSELEDWILNGYNGGVSIDPDTGYLWIEGSPGLRVALKDELQDRIGETVIVCAYDQVTGEGSNAQFRITKFLSLTITEVTLTASNDLRNVSARVETMVNVADAEMGGSTSSNLVKVSLVL